MRPSRDPNTSIRRRRNPDASASPTPDAVSPAPESAAPAAEPEIRAVRAQDIAPPRGRAQEVTLAPEPVLPARGGTNFDDLKEIADMSADDIRNALNSFTRNTPSTRLRRGQRITGRITRLTASTAFIDVGTKADAILERVELDSSASVGDTIEAFVSSSHFDGEVKLTRTPSGDAAIDMLDEAKRHKTVIQGKVTGKNDHGYTVTLAGGLRAFCFSTQIDMPPVVEPESYINRTLPFRVVEVKGKEAIVSHRSVAEEIAAEAAVRELESLREGDVFEGTITKVMDFGAFVKLPNGVEGLVHVSNLSKNKVAKPQEFVKEGQSVKVKVLSVDPRARKVSLGMKQAERDEGVIRDTRNAELRQSEGVGFNALAQALSGWKKK